MWKTQSVPASGSCVTLCVWPCSRYCIQKDFFFRQINTLLWPWWNSEWFEILTVSFGIGLYKWGNQRQSLVRAPVRRGFPFLRCWTDWGGRRISLGRTEAWCQLGICYLSTKELFSERWTGGWIKQEKVMVFLISSREGRKVGQMSLPAPDIILINGRVLREERKHTIGHLA